MNGLCRELMAELLAAGANEMIRCAVDHPYKDAAETFSRNHASKVSADTISEIVGLYRERSSAFVKGIGAGKKDEADARAKTVCIMGEGTGMPMRKECLQGAKGKDGRAKTREVKAGAMFIASKTKDNEPHRDIDTTTYVATTHRREKFGKYFWVSGSRRGRRSGTTATATGRNASGPARCKTSSTTCGREWATSSRATPCASTSTSAATQEG